jgi:hypothetical protein
MKGAIFEDVNVRSTVAATRLWWTTFACNVVSSRELAGTFAGDRSRRLACQP